MPINALLGRQVWMAGWPTPQASDGSGGGQALRAMGDTRHGSNLNDFTMLAGWKTPVVNDATGNPESAMSMTRPSPTNGHWRAADWLLCRDGKWRPVEPGTFPLAHGASSRVGRLRAYGNAINAKAAQVFIGSVM